MTDPNYNFIIQQYQQRLADSTLEAVTLQSTVNDNNAELARLRAEVARLQSSQGTTNDDVQSDVSGDDAF